MSDKKPICWKCRGEVTRVPISGPNRAFKCDRCGHYLSDREAFNPEHARVHHEEAEKGPEARELSKERLEEIAICFESMRIASASAKRLFPGLFDAADRGGLPDPFTMGVMAGELIGHCAWLTKQINELTAEREAAKAQ